MFDVCRACQRAGWQASVLLLPRPSYRPGDVPEPADAHPACPCRPVRRPAISGIGADAGSRKRHQGISQHACRTGYQSRGNRCCHGRAACAIGTGPPGLLRGKFGSAMLARRAVVEDADVCAIHEPGDQSCCGICVPAGLKPPGDDSFHQSYLPCADAIAAGWIQLFCRIATTDSESHFQALQHNGLSAGLHNRTGMNVFVMLLHSHPGRLSSVTRGHRYLCTSANRTSAAT